jgi:DNA helicase-2/ATP-dependent DNA helicase PcrA
MLAPVVQAELFEVPPLLKEVLASDDTGEQSDDEDESRRGKMRLGLAQLLDARWSEVGLYHEYLKGNALQATHQVVKGSEFENVMVIMDDKAAGGFLFSYDKLFGAKLGKADLENAKAGKETAVDRTLRLLYVTCSRARESLALVLWAAEPTAAIDAAAKSDWFRSKEVLPVPEA